MSLVASTRVFGWRISPSTISTRLSNIVVALDLVLVNARTVRSLANNLATANCPTPPVAPATKILSVFDTMFDFTF